MLLSLLVPVAAAIAPKATYDALPDKAVLPYEESRVATVDGASLAAWWFANPKKTTRTVVFVHDGTGNMGDDLARVEAFRGLGYNVVTFDYRGFGASSAFEMDPNMYLYPHFQDDVKAVIAWAATKAGAPVDVHGWGIGAGLGLGIGWNMAEVAGIFADGPFASMEDLDKVFSSYDAPPEVPFAGFDKHNEPVYALEAPPTIAPKGTKRVLLVASAGDDVCSKELLGKLAKKQPKYVLDTRVLDNPGKGETFAADRTAYTALAGAWAKAK